MNESLLFFKIINDLKCMRNMRNCSLILMAIKRPHNLPMGALSSLKGELVKGWGDGRIPRGLKFRNHVYFEQWMEPYMCARRKRCVLERSGY